MPMRREVQQRKVLVIQGRCGIDMWKPPAHLDLFREAGGRTKRGMLGTGWMILRHPAVEDASECGTHERR